MRIVLTHQTRLPDPDLRSVFRDIPLTPALPLEIIAPRLGLFDRLPVLEGDRRIGLVRSPRIVGKGIVIADLHSSPHALPPPGSSLLVTLTMEQVKGVYRKLLTATAHQITKDKK